jgi:hypothetical protein
MSKTLTFASVLLPREFENLFFEIDVGKLNEAILFLIFDLKFLTYLLIYVERLLWFVNMYLKKEVAQM